ncbi:MAG: xanthine dehydrogenase molybdopterin binding subunit, partial [Pseudomonadota bacterium]
MNRSDRTVMTTAGPGNALAHESAAAHVTGTAPYIDDLPLPADALHIATGYVQDAVGTITSLDLTAVRAAPAVVDVIVAQDVPGQLDVGAVYPGDLLLADGAVTYAAQPLFAVVATSLRAAQQATRLATVELDRQSPRVTTASAREAEDYVLPTRRWQRGTAPAAASAHQISGALAISGQEHFYLEGQAALAIPEEADTLRVHSSTQHPDEVQHLVAAVLGIGMHKVRVICRRMGGGFGGKESQAAPLACLAALAARRNGRAVSYRMPRQDDMLQTGKRHAFDARYTLACDAQGLIESASIELAGQCGHSPDLSEGVVDRAMFHACNAYYLPHAEITGYRCRTHTVSATAFRGFGGPQGMLAIEAAMDDLAHASGIDPLTLRQRNLFAPGRDVTPYGQQIDQFLLADLLETLETRCDYRTRQVRARAFNERSTQFKRGLALTPVQFGISFTATHLNQAGALVNIYTDGTIEVNHAGTEMGQGLFTKMQQVAARAFGVAPDRISLGATQTDKVPNGSPTAASSGSDLNGMAVRDACEQLKARFATFAKDTLGWGDAPLAFVQDTIRCGSHSLPFDEFVHAAYMARVSLSAAGFYKTPDIHFDKEAGHGHPFFYYAHGAAASEVLIDCLTGEYRLLQVDILHDAGESLNPAVD